MAGSQEEPGCSVKQGFYSAAASLRQQRCCFDGNTAERGSLPWQRNGSRRATAVPGFRLRRVCSVVKFLLDCVLSAQSIFDSRFSTVAGRLL